MRRGWVVAGVVTLVAVPTVPVAAAGVSLVLERVNGTEGVGKWVRTGDMQRFRVRLNGMGRGAKVAVAASPVTALEDVACVPSPPGQGSRRSAGPEASGGPVSEAVAGPSDATQALNSSEAADVGAAHGAHGAGASQAAHGAAAGRSAHGAGAGRSGTGGSAVASGAAQADGSGPATSKAAVGALAMRALTVAGASAMAGALPPGTRVCRLGKVAGERAVDVTVRAPEGAREVVLAAAARMRRAEDRGLTTLSRTAAMKVKGRLAGDAATFTGPARLLRPGESDGAGSLSVETGKRPANARTATTPQSATAPGTAVTPGAAAVPGAATAPRAAAVPGAVADPGAVAAPGVVGAPQAVVPGAAAVPGGGSAVILPDTVVMPSAGIPSGTGAGAIPQVMSTTAASAPDLFASFQAAVPSGEPPLPWEMAVSARPVRPAGWVSPLDGPRALPMAAGGIALLMGGLWLVVTVQRGRNRRKVL